MAVSPVEIQEFLEDVDYPATKQQLIEYAREQGADEDTVSILERLDRDDFNSAQELTEALDRIMAGGQGMQDGGSQGEEGSESQGQM